MAKNNADQSAQAQLEPLPRARLTALDWVVRADQVPAKGYRRTFEASQEERAAYSEEIGVPACTSLGCEIEFRRTESGFHMQGRYWADLTLACSVTLDPVQQRIADEIDQEFRYGIDDVAFGDDPGFDVFADEQPEPVRNGRLEIGPLIGEYVASEVDLFPRAEGATLDHAEAGGSAGTANEGSAPDNPFAVLARLKSSPTDGNSGE